MMEILLVWRHVHLIIVYQDLFANMFLSDLKYSEGRKEGRKDMFLVYLRLYGVRHVFKDHRNNEREN